MIVCVQVLQHKLQMLSYHNLSHQFEYRMSQFMSSCHGQIERDVFESILFGLNGSIRTVNRYAAVHVRSQRPV